MSNSIDNADRCALCQYKVKDHPVIHEALAFCCHGCQAVFSILKTKGVEVDYQTHPLFKQAVAYGLISNPDIIAHSKDKLADQLEYNKFHFEIDDLWCPSCAELIRLILLQEAGVKSCIVDYATDLAVVEYAPQKISREKIFSIIENLGYHPSIYEDAGTKTISRSLYLRFIIAAFCSLNVMMFAYPLYATYFDYDDQMIGELFAWLSMMVSLPVIAYSGWPIFKRFLNALAIGLYGMEALVTIGVASSFGLSVYMLLNGSTQVYFDSMCVIITFVLLGKIIESKAKFSAKESLLRMNRALPKRGRKQSPEGFIYTPIKDIFVGDILQVLMGETIVLDGIVIDGFGYCNEALMTGESRLIQKSQGAKVIGGTQLQQGNLLIQVTTTANQSTLSRIVEMIESDISRKSSYVRAADRIARWFIPIVIAIAMVVFFVWYSLGLYEGNVNALENAVLCAVTVLLISCPCAIGIAAPLAESYLIDALSSLGAIVRNRGALQWLGGDLTYIFDKTGTLTEGSFDVLEGVDLLSASEQSALKGLVERSCHPIAIAIGKILKQVPALKFDKVEEIPGHGMRGYISGQACWLGSDKFMNQQGIKFASKKESNGIVTQVYFADLSGGVHSILLGDQLRKGIKEALRFIPSDKKILLSGDGNQCVAEVALQSGIAIHYASKSPLEKRELIEQLKREGKAVCMVGDGINDAPALTAANIGISVVNASDISIQVSDIFLTTDKLEILFILKGLGAFGHRIIHQNLFWAFIYNVVGIGLAAMGLLCPIFAAFAMTISSIVIIMNTLRMKNNKNNS